MMEFFQSAAAELWASASPARLCQACFALASCAVLAVAVAPSKERKLLVNYGARSHGDLTSEAVDELQARRMDEGMFHRSVRKLTAVGQVPHMWFFTFYLTYIVCALFWAGQYLFNASALRTIGGRQAEEGAPGPTRAQVAVAWCLMLLQAVRRLYESWAFAAPSKSTMWIVHWVLGQFFYVGMSVAIWVEGSGPILRDQKLSFTVLDLTADALSKVAIALPIYFFAWVTQYRCHMYLAGLKKYSLPDQGMFRHLISPHYTCECLVYFSLAILTAPKGYLCNHTLLSALLFVAVNLGVTARGTKRWYVEKFGSDSVARKNIMIPVVF